MRDGDGRAHRRDHRQLARVLGMVRRPFPAGRWGTRSSLRAQCSKLLTYIRALLRDCHIAAIPFSDVHTVGHLLLDLVERLIRQGEFQMRPTICPIDLESDYHAGIGSHIWVSLHPCMHWCGSVGLNIWTQDLKRTTCPVCRTPIRFLFELIQDE